MPHKPELLAPAGDWECLRAAVACGADAVYLAAKNFGMRASPSNFSWPQLKEAVTFAHQQQVKVYLTCNILPRNADIPVLPDFLRNAQDCGVDALILSDLGILQLAKQVVPEIDIHISTQMGITNYAAANALADLHARRIVLARELSLEEIALIKAELPEDIEIECFIHGAMCVSFSGRCLLSSYLTGRDANAGDCAQPCRWKYTLVEEKRPGVHYPIDEDASGSHIMNAKDLCMIKHIPQLIQAGIDCFKIEGRAKSAYYTAVITNAYRCAIDGYYACTDRQNYQPEDWILQEVEKVSYREYCTGFFFDAPLKTAHVHPAGGYRRDWEIAAVVSDWANGRAIVSQRNRFFQGEQLEVFLPGQQPFPVLVSDLRNVRGEPCETAPNPMQEFSFSCEPPLPAGAILRRRK